MHDGVKIKVKLTILLKTRMVQSLSAHLAHEFDLTIVVIYDLMIAHLRKPHRSP